MPRLFIGLGLPEEVTARLTILQGGIPGARWEPAEKMHLTLRFLGDADGGTMRRLIDRLGALDAPAFEMSLVGVGHFPPRGEPRSLWAGVEAGDELIELKGRVDRIVDGLGFHGDPRKFAPHVTLARMRGAPRGRIAEFESHHGLLRVGPFTQRSVRLYSSILSPGGSKYRVEAAVALRET